MKNRLMTSIFGLVSIVIVGAANASAQSEFELCQQRAGERYDTCRSNSGSNCDSRLDRSMDACLVRFNDRSSAEQSGARFDYNGRFVPTQIPQRPTYVLPGMR